MKTFVTIFTTLLLSLVLSACSSSPKSDTSVGNTVFQQAKAKCKQMGGEWTRGGTLTFYGCLRPARDAGNACTDSVQCEFHCNAAKGEKPEPGQSATGQCQATNSYKGCHIEISKGIAKPVFCSKI